MEHRQVAAHHQVIDAGVVAGELLGGHLAGGDDGVVVVDLGVVDDPRQRQHVQPGHILGGLAVHRQLAQVGGDRLELADHVAGKKLGSGTRVGEQRPGARTLVQPLCGLQGARRRDAVAAVGVALQRGQVVQQRGTGLALGALDRLDGGGLARSGRGDRVGPFALGGAVGLALEPASAIAAVAGERKLGVDLEVGLGLEGVDLEIALDDQRQRGRLHPAQRHDAAQRPAPDGGRAGGIHADQPVGLRAGAGGGLEVCHLLARPQVLEGVADRRLGHRVDPQPLYRLLRFGLVVDVGEDQLALAPGVAAVDHLVHVVALEQPLDHVKLLAAARLGAQLELLGQHRQGLDRPALQRRVVVLGLGQLDQVADRPGHDLVAGFEVALVLLEGAAQGLGIVLTDRRLLCDDQSLPHRRGRVARGRRPVALRHVHLVRRTRRFWQDHPGGTARRGADRRRPRSHPSTGARRHTRRRADPRAAARSRPPRSARGQRRFCMPRRARNWSMR